MTFAWWCAAGALTIISTALYRREMAILIAANPAARLPWLGRPASTPRSAKVLQFFALFSMLFAGDCVFGALGQRHLYDVLWELPIMLIPVVAMTVRQAQHNCRVRSAT